MPLRRPDPGTFEHLLQPVRVDVTTLVRLSKHPRTELWWSRGRCRFDGPPKGNPGSFGTCYAATTIGAAFAESVIHESSWFNGDHYAVPLADLQGRHIISLDRPGREKLTLADFTGSALRRMGLNNDISSGDDYRLPMAWAQAVHDAEPTWDGIVYVSRQNNLHIAVALFERSGVQINSSRPLEGSLLDELCDLFGVIGI